MAQTDEEMLDIAKARQKWHEGHQVELRVDAHGTNERLRMCCASNLKKRSAKPTLTTREAITYSKRITQCPVAINFRFDEENDLYGPH